MHAEEMRALRRAAVILLAVSAVRGGWSARGPSREAGTESGLPTLIEDTRGATEEDARRRTPLEEGERLDPNRASDADLDRLPGVGPATALAIVAARDSGAIFRTPDDLLAVRGIGEGTLARIRPHLELSAPGGPARADGVRPAQMRRRPADPPAGVRIDLNRADRGALEGLPGVGPALASRILAAREERMFTSLEDLERVPGIGPATIERLRPHATVWPAR
jgi:competence ComEA-like helix-hairpin-helix protein